MYVHQRDIKDASAGIATNDIQLPVYALLIHCYLLVKYKKAVGKNYHFKNGYIGKIGKTVIGTFIRNMRTEVYQPKMNVPRRSESENEL